MMLTRACGLATQTLSVVNNVAKQQFTVSFPGAVAQIDYQESGNNIKFIYTGVPVAFQGKGVGKVLAKYAFDYAADKKLNVTCKCHFLTKYYKDNKAQYPELKITFE